MQMLLVGRALIARPKLLMLDEPSVGLAPNIAEELFATIAAINREQGLTILLVEQNAHAAMCATTVTSLKAAVSSCTVRAKS